MGVAYPKAFIRLEHGIPGVDHVKSVDHEDLAGSVWADVDCVGTAVGVDTFQTFYVHQSHNPRWHAASEGLKCIRAVQAEMLKRMKRAQQSQRDYTRTLESLASLEQVLVEADLRDIQFCFVGNF